MAALARVERTDFLSPMCIGEVAHVSAEITYTSKHSVEVQVHVMSENILTGNSQCFSLATLAQRQCSALLLLLGQNMNLNQLGEESCCFSLETIAVTW